MLIWHKYKGIYSISPYDSCLITYCVYHSFSSSIVLLTSFSCQWLSTVPRILWKTSKWLATSLKWDWRQNSWLGIISHVSGNIFVFGKTGFQTSHGYIFKILFKIDNYSVLLVFQSFGWTTWWKSGHFDQTYHLQWTFSSQKSKQYVFVCGTVSIFLRKGSQGKPNWSFQIIFCKNTGIQHLSRGSFFCFKGTGTCIPRLIDPKVKLLTLKYIVK